VLIISLVYHTPMVIKVTLALFQRFDDEKYP
jgi:hypothetical protein